MTESLYPLHLFLKMSLLSMEEPQPEQFHQSLHPRKRAQATFPLPELGEQFRFPEEAHRRFQQVALLLDQRILALLRKEPLSPVRHRSSEMLKLAEAV